ncbi:ABC transporter permease [Flavobacteriaceae bacterium]|jgi:putative ABC transport system permease protein|nr:ABC transporter permease [Flavobacteriaceae bacterium]MDA7808395.1 ABC transporter permease [Flavobacteriaceae bacterium]MDA8877661.1 ABC transporter permease [Flavobacteriaceae bacterium]MDA9037880.1 ABC transporter permease [Flavobacteriaceae bacterium]MDA9852022.1 ABC transporter permease [Flavobacteriaceae bacterium]
MFNRDRWREIFETIGKNKLRTFLSGFTVALGIFIFIILFGLGNGLKNTFQEFFLDDASNAIFIYPGKTSKPYKGFKANRRIEFKNDDVKEIEENFAFFIEHLTPRIRRSALTKYKNESNTYSTRAVAPGHQFVEKTILMKGRYVNQSDLEEKKKSAVIGRLVAKDLFKGEDPLGKFINIGSIAFKVVGVFQDDGGDNEERYIYIPYTTRQLIEKSNDKVDQIIVTFRKELGHSGALALEKSIKKYLKEKKSIAPSDPNGIYFQNLTDDLKQSQQFAVVLQLIVSFVGLGTLIAGIIGISNIMVFVVKERTKELGIRKALGATPRSVIQMILQESVFITTISGYIGLFLGVLLLENIGLKLEDYFIKNPFIDFGTALAATVVLIIFGAIAGYIPAKRASSIKPIVALRDE